MCTYCQLCVCHRSAGSPERWKLRAAANQPGPTAYDPMISPRGPDRHTDSAGATFGEFSLIHKCTRTASVTCTSRHVTCLALEEDAFKDLFPAELVEYLSRKLERDVQSSNTRLTSFGMSEGSPRRLVPAMTVEHGE